MSTHGDDTASLEFERNVRDLLSESRSFESHLETGINGCHIRLVCQLKTGNYPQTRSL